METSSVVRLINRDVICIEITQRNAILKEFRETLRSVCIYIDIYIYMYTGNTEFDIVRGDRAESRETRRRGRTSL